MANEGDNYDENDELWFLNLQEFLDNTDAMITQKNQSIDSIPNFLKNLESFDSNFHQHSLVQQIRNKIEIELSPMIQQCIEKSINSENNLLLSHIDSYIMNSDTFSNVSEYILDSISEAAGHLKDIFNSNTFSFFNNSILNNKSSDKEEIFYCDDSVCSTVDSSDYMFMSAEHYKELAQEIDPSNSIHLRLQALTTLTQVHQVDLVSSESWSLAKEGLVSCLSDDNEEIAVQVLKLVSRLFFTGSSHVVKEFLSILIQNLIEYFNDNTSHMVSIETGLDLGDKRNILLFRKFRLLVQIIVELPVYWLRYSENIMEDIVEMLVDLLCITPTPITETIGKYLMTPLHFVSLLDPQATWFQNWMHSFYGRSHLINSIRRNITFVKNLLKNFLITARNFLTLQEFSEEEEYISYNDGDIHYTYFVHTVHVMTKLMFHKEGIELFNFEVNNGAVVSIKNLIEKLIKVLKTAPVLTDNDVDIHPCSMLVNLIKSLSCIDSSSCKGFICDLSVCQSLLEPLVNKEIDISRKLFCALAEILIEIARCDSGRKILLAMHDMIGPRLLSLIELFNSTIDDQVFILLLELISNVFNTPDGVLRIHNSSLFVELYHNFLRQQALFEGLAKTLQKDSLPKYIGVSKLELKLAECLLSFAITPKGFDSLESSGALGKCILFFIEKHSRKKEDFFVSKHFFSTLMNHIVASRGGVVALKETGYLTSLLCNTWCHLEGSSNDYTKTMMCDIPEDLSDRTSNELYNSIVMLFSSFPAVKQLLLDEEPNDNPNHTEMKSFHDFLSCSVFLETQPLLSHFEQTHFFGLNIIAAIVSCLDSMIFIEVNFSLCKVLLNLQEQCKYDDGFIIDQCSLKRNEILVRLLLLGGESERLIPPETILQEDVGFCLPLFSQLPVPDIYELASSSFKLSSANNGPISLFLSEFKVHDWDNNELILIHEKAIVAVISEIRLGNIQENLDLGAFLILVVDMHKKGLSCDKMLTDESTNLDSNIILRSEDNYAIDLVAKYGCNLRLVGSKSEAVSGLKELISRITNLLYTESSSCQRYCGFDWFTSVIFLVFRGDSNAAWGFLKRFSCLKSSTYIWMAKFDGKMDKQKFNIHPGYTKVCHYIEMLLEKELPHVYSAFCLAGYPVSSICLLWLRQSFLNYLDWPEILCYITGSIVIGVDFPVYFSLAVFNHLQADILLHQQSGNLVRFLRSCTLSKFLTGEHIDFIMLLSRRYSSSILGDLLEAEI